MRFRKNWGAIWQEKVVLCVAIVASLSSLVYALVRANVTAAIIAGCFIWPVIVFYVKWKMVLGPGFFSDMIELNERGVMLREKENNLFFQWGEVRKIIRTRYNGTNALAILNENGEMIWFYRNTKIENAILELYPEAKELIVEDLRFFRRKT